MAPYLLLYTYIVSSLYISENEDIYHRTKIKNFSIFDSDIVFLVTFLFVACRGNGNGDYYNYLNGVKYVDTIDFVFFPKNYPFELGFRILSYISNLLSLNPQFVLISMNFISFSSIYYVLKKTKTNIYFGLLAFFPIMLLYDMHHSRSAVAMSLGMVFFVKMWEYDLKHWWKSLFYLILAFLFHKSAIVLLLLIPIVYYYKYAFIVDEYTIQKERKVTLIFFMGLFLIFVIFDPVYIFVNILDNSLTISFYKKLSSYLANPRWSYPFKMYDPRLILTFISYYSFYILEKDRNFVKSNDLFYLSIHQFYFISLLALVVLNVSTLLALRVYHMFNISVVIYYPKLLEILKLDSQNDKKIKISIFLLYALYTIVLIYKQFPYTTFLHDF